MLPEWLLVLIFFPSVIVAHEIGHIVAFKAITDRWPRVRYVKGSIEVEGDIKRSEEHKVFLAGIVAGIVPFLVFLDILSWWLLLLAFIAYLFGCLHDFRELEVLRREKA